jgi:fructose-bisphosphate aldolase class II
MLTNFNYLLKDAIEKDYGVGIIEVWDLHTVKAAVEAAVEENSPSALLAGQNFIEGIGVNSFADLALSYINNVEVPIALCLDECKDFDFIVKCIKAGFSFVMFDGAIGEHGGGKNLSFEDNLRITQNVVRVSHAVNVTVEASLGDIPLSEGGIITDFKNHMFNTNPEQAKVFVEQTGIDILAPSIGNIHCLYKDKWPEPDWVLAENIVKKVGIPCALHGASGATDDQIRKAISIGFRKVNIGTRYNEIYRQALIRELQKCEGLGCPYNSSIAAGEAYKSEAKRLMRDVYRSSNRFVPLKQNYWTIEKLNIKQNGAYHNQSVEINYKKIIDTITEQVLKKIN